MGTATSHIRLRDIGLTFRLYANKSFSLREMFLSPLKSAKQNETFAAVRGIQLKSFQFAQECRADGKQSAMGGV